jgi:hypothetical protein
MIKLATNETQLEVSREAVIRLKNRAYRQYQDECGPRFDSPKAFHLIGMMEAYDQILDMEDE